jgi:hypothetical protein
MALTCEITGKHVNEMILFRAKLGFAGWTLVLNTEFGLLIGRSKV